MSDEAVRSKTGRSWPEWFALLDQVQATRMTHPEIAAFLAEHHQVGPWWQQMVTVAYEQARGLRLPHERPEGFQVSISKTLSVPLEATYRAWSDANARSRWLPEAGFTIRKETPNKSMRITWVDGKSSLDVDFYARGEDKSQVVVQHGKLASVRDVEAMKTYWSAALGKLKKVLEG
jgi:uncharacterized protein YndB with AHSA1/START domain